MARFLWGAIVLVALAACESRPEPAVSHPEGGDKVTTVRLASSNVYFIETARGYVMVDAGMSARGKAVEELFSRAGIEPEEVSLIIVTHVHPDHVGGLASAKTLTGAKVLCHRSVAELIAKGKSEPIVAHGAWGAFLAAISPKGFRGVVPEILVDKERGLDDYGLAGTVIHAPGHTSGSIAIVLSDGETLVGDQVRGEAAELSLGRFYEDRELLLRNLERVAASQPRVIHMSHGTCTDTSNLSGFIGVQKGLAAGGEDSSITPRSL